MHKFNVLIIGDNKSKSIAFVKKSKFLNKLYTNFEAEHTTNINFNTFKELCLKCKALKIDIVIVENTKFVLQGICDILRKNYINCIALNAFWTELVLSRDFASKMLIKYNIRLPQKLTYPKQFPLFIKADGISKLILSLEDLIAFRNNLDISPERKNTLFLEEFINGEKIHFTTLFDGKNLIGYSQNELIQEYKNSLQTMFINENSNFIGFITSKIIINNNKLYNVGFDINFPTFNSDIDIIYLLNSTIYQKLNEIELISPF